MEKFSFHYRIALNFREISKINFKIGCWDILMEIKTFKKLFYLTRHKFLIRRIEFLEILNLWFKSYESCSIFGTFPILINLSKISINAYHMVQNFIFNSVESRFLKIAHANFSNRDFSTVCGRNKIQIQHKIPRRLICSDIMLILILSMFRLKITIA